VSAGACHGGLNGWTVVIAASDSPDNTVMTEHPG
jgi:transposase InsO family protein